MWPLRAVELGEAIASAAVPMTGSLGADVADDVVRRAIGWPGLAPSAGDVFFVVEKGLYAQVRSGLAAGAFCVVGEHWPGLATLEPALRSRRFVSPRPLAAYRGLAGYLRARFPFLVIAVGGSNGKTTTKDSIATLLAENGRHVTSTRGTDNGWVGTATTLCRPDHTSPPPDALVLEIGIDEKGAMREHAQLAMPDIAVLTALGPEHLSGLGSHDDAIREELELFAASKRRVWLEDEPALGARLDQVRAGDVIVRSQLGRATPADVDVLTYSWRRASATHGELTIEWRGETLTSVVPLPGAHNGRNAALAIACALLAGRRIEEVATALGSLRAPAQRCTVRTLASGCILIDDSYNASPSSVDAALDVLEGFDPTRTRLVIFGDMLDLGDESTRLHEALAPRLASLDGAHIRLFGEHARELAPLLANTLASVGRAAPPEDPRSLIDLPSLDRTVVLVKGSRGMSLERVVAHVEALGAEKADDRALRVGITGTDALSLAMSLRERIPRATIRVLTVDDLANGAAARHPVDVAIITTLDIEGTDPERDLAAVAQLLLNVRTGGSAYLCESDQAEDPEPAEAMALLADVVPPGVTTRRLPSSMLISAVIAEIDSRFAKTSRI